MQYGPEINPYLALHVAKAISSTCGLHTTISRCVSDTRSSWLITVEEDGWRRHLVLQEITDDGTGAQLDILSSKQSDKSGSHIDTKDIDERITLSRLIRNGYDGLKIVLGMTSPAAVS
jgi:hypothetical protein